MSKWEKTWIDTQIDLSWIWTWDSFDEEYCKNNWWNIKKEVLTDGYSISYCFFDDGSFCESVKFYDGTCSIWENVNETTSEFNEYWIPRIFAWTQWHLMAFNGSEVNGEYVMNISNSWELFTKFCNNIWWTINIDWDNEKWIISALLVQTEMFCDNEEYMVLEKSFDIDWSTYTIRINEDYSISMILTTKFWDKFMWRSY